MLAQSKPDYARFVIQHSRPTKSMLNEFLCNYFKHHPSYLDELFFRLVMNSWTVSHAAKLF